MSEREAAAYFRTRLAFDEKRQVLWETLVERVFQPMIAATDVVVELGAGWCDFINNVQAGRRVAVDLWDGIEARAAPGVEAHVPSAESLAFLGNGTVDMVFASNLLEHLTHDEVGAVVDEARRALVPGGRLVLVQPNFRLCAKNYFDDYTHVSMWSDVGLPGYVQSRGWEVEEVRARFLPLTVKSRLPVSRVLIRAYLSSPIKPMAGQMLVIARHG